MNSGTEYSDDQGEMDGIGEQPVDDFLPPPEALSPRGRGHRMTVTLDDQCAEFVAREARLHKSTDADVVRAILKDYAQRHNG